MIATKIGFFGFRVHFDPVKLRFCQLLFYPFLNKIRRLNHVHYKYWSKCWYLSLKTALEAVSDENRPKFFKANFIPLKLTYLRFFWLIMGKIKCSLCLKKPAKKSIFVPKIALRVERSDPARNPYFPANFLSARLKCSRLLHNCGKFLLLNWRALGLELLDKPMHNIQFHLNWWNII